MVVHPGTAAVTWQLVCTPTVTASYALRQLMMSCSWSANQAELLPMTPGCRSDNSLSGTIPASWLPPNLTILYASHNRLMLPPDGHLPLPPLLAALVLSGNPLNGPVPASLHNHTSLRLVDLDGCGLVGTLPAAPLPRSLTHLNLDANNLSGTIPFAAWDLPESLIELFLSGNRLTGPLPHTLPASLWNLYLSFNALTGSLPGELLSNLPTNLTKCMLSNNRLTGQLPQAIAVPPGRPDVGLYIDLSNNSFWGPLPTAWEFGPQHGTNTSWFGPVSMDLTFNRLTGGLGGHAYGQRACDPLHQLACCSRPRSAPQRTAGTLPAWDPTGRHFGFEATVLPQQGAGFCGQASWDWMV